METAETTKKTGRGHAFTDAQARELARRYAAGESQRSLAGELGVSPSVVHACIKRVAPELKRNYSAGLTLTEGQAQDLAKKYMGGATQLALAEEYGVAPATVRRYLRRMLPEFEKEASAHLRSRRRDNEYIDERIAFLDEMRGLLVAVRDGGKISELCRERNLDYLKVMRFFDSENLELFRPDRRFVPASEAVGFIASPHERLFADALGLSEPDMARTVPPADLEETVEHLLGTLTEREEEVVRLLYGLGGGDPMTLRETARECGVSYERVRQLEDKGMRKLRTPSSRKTLVNGLAVTEARRKAKEEVEAYKLAAIEEEKRKAVEKVRAERRKRNGSVQAIAAVSGDAVANACEAAKATEISYLNFSVRSYNCLSRMGISTVHEALCLTDGQMAGIRNLGAKSMHGIIHNLSSWLSEYGLTREEYQAAFGVHDA